MQSSNQPTREQILVALDASPYSLAALRAAANLAALLQAELHGIFVEDEELLRLCGLPFSREIGLLSAQPRQLESQAIERQLRAQAATLRRTLAQIAEGLQLHWSFRVTRGRVPDQLLAAAENALLLSLGRVGRSLGRSMGGTTQVIVERAPLPVLVTGKDGQVQPPYTVLYTGTASAARALRLATRLAQSSGYELQLWVPGQATDIERNDPQIASTREAAGVRSRLTYFATADTLQRALTTARTGTLILPVEQLEWLAKLSGPVIVVP